MHHETIYHRYEASEWLIYIFSPCLHISTRNGATSLNLVLMLDMENYSDS